MRWKRRSGRWTRPPQALEQGDLRGALERQAEALDALREGLRACATRRPPIPRERDGTEGEDPQEQGQGAGARPPGPRDGRRTREGQDFGSIVPGEDPRARARELLDEIRRRSAERERTEANATTSTG